MVVDMEKIDAKKWLLDNYTFFDDIFEYDEMYYLEFCLKEHAISFVKLCCKHNITFTYLPPYDVVIAIVQVKMLMRKGDYLGDFNMNHPVYFETHPLLKLH